MNRFIKFVTDIYVLDQTRTIKTNVADSAISFHYINFPNSGNSSNLMYPSWSNNAVCMLQINNDIKNANTIETTMLIYLQNLMLFDMDLSDLTSNYPSNIFLQSYALNSLPMWPGSFSGSFVTNYAWYQSDFSYSTLDYSSTSPQNPRMEMRTIYKQFLGSALWINLPKPLSSILGSNDLLIPTYCPVISTNISCSTTNSYYQPIINIVFVYSTGFAMSIINQHWAPYKAGLNSSCLYFTMTNSQIAKTLPSTMYDSPVYTTLRFNS